MINYLSSIIFIIIIYFIIGEVFKDRWTYNGWMNAPAKKLTQSESWVLIFIIAAFPFLRWFVILTMVAAAFYTPEELKEKLNIREDE